MFNQVPCITRKRNGEKIVYLRVLTHSWKANSSQARSKKHINAS